MSAARLRAPTASQYGMSRIAANLAGLSGAHSDVRFTCTSIRVDSGFDISEIEVM